MQLLLPVEKNKPKHSKTNIDVDYHGIDQSIEAFGSAVK